MNDNKLKIRSTNENLRLCIIENSIFIDELLSDIIGEILNINWKESKSFGFESCALSFNQKIQIIQDIKGIEKEDLKKLTCIANIRNKFAHVSHIESFNDLFTLSKVGKQIKSEFMKWYFDEKCTSDIAESKIELVFRLCFYLLIDNVVEIIFKVYSNHFFELGKKDGKQEFKDKFIESLVAFIKDQPGGKKAISQAIDSIVKEQKYNNQLIKTDNNVSSPRRVPRLLYTFTKE